MPATLTTPTTLSVVSPPSLHQLTSWTAVMQGGSVVVAKAVVGERGIVDISVSEEGGGLNIDQWVAARRSADPSV
ncbi:uncharacterized protein ARMOST_13618 [Armillaria ostoyae]|uniref:Uncharacterized protein n=1 Tax=Armillaria ostoyae TaxID=47428 RepID=A0A284RNE0_ARMOS|nr:uncharacterized protein ARMOST_13618 [Armillaria ostoyae]